MNRLIRIILYITAACVGIGSAALILGLILGGRDSFVEDAGFTEARNFASDVVSEIRDRIRHHRQRKMMESDAAEQTAEDDYDVDYGYMYDDDYDDQYEIEADDDIYGDELILKKAASEIQNLEADLRHGYLQIDESDDEQVWVSMTGPVKDISVECEDGTLVIQDGRQGKSSREDAYIYLRIPEDMRFQIVNVQADAGVMEADCSLEADQLTLSANAGNIIISEAESAMLTASVGAGSIQMEGVFGKVKLDCGVGTINMEAEISQNSQISCGMGSVDVELEDDVESVNYVLSCGMGCIDIGDNSYTALSSEKRIDHGASATFTLSCGMGEICIE